VKVLTVQQTKRSFGSNTKYVGKQVGILVNGAENTRNATV